VNGGEVNCESHDVDRYHRALSTCSVNMQNINRELVRQGWAVAYSPHGPSFDYVDDEAEARRLKRGIWQGAFEQPSDYRKRLRTVQGNVAGMSEPDD
jgi:endonuclease YncB( thermonuclease family)